MEMHHFNDGTFKIVPATDGEILVDGMNVNEDNVSVIKFSGGEVEKNAALGAEGDGVDSNGYVRIDGGNININGIRVINPGSCSRSKDDGNSYIILTIND